MKKILSFIVISILINCGGDKKQSIETTSTEKVNSKELQKFNSVKEMLSNAGDYSTENGTLKFINESSDKLHIQISKPILEGDLEKTINEIVKRDIVYVAFQTFAQTPVKKITITSIPIDLNNSKKYYDKYKIVKTINKNSVDEIMNSEFGTNDYSILFSKMGNTQIPSKDFDKLKFEKLEEVFGKLK